MSLRLAIGEMIRCNPPQPGWDECPPQSSMERLKQGGVVCCLAIGEVIKCNFPQPG